MATKFTAISGTSSVIVARVATSSVSGGGAPTGTVSVDGANASNNSLVLLTANGANNGIWKVNTAGAWTKNTPFQPVVVLVTTGTSFTQSQWFLSAANTYKIVRGALA